ncbi:hypothetical protein ACHAPJ_000992 [Fusarium lateritium]
MSPAGDKDSKVPRPRNSNLGLVLQNWIVAHDGRLWQTTEETTAITEQTAFTKSQINNWFASRRKTARLALERVLLETPAEFISAYSAHAAETLKHFFATVAEHGYLPEAGKSLMAESTGLSTRSIVDLFDKLRQDTRFAYAAATITSMQMPSSITQADTGQPVNNSNSLSSPISPVTVPKPAALIQLSQSPAPSQPMQVEQVAGMVPTTSVASAPAPTIPQSLKKRKRNSVCLQPGHIFAWHRGRQVNLTVEVEPLLRNHPGVHSATCLS